MKNYKFTISGHTYEVDILEIEDDIAKIEVNGTPYMVEIDQQVKQVKTPTLIRHVMKEPQKNIEKKDSSTRLAVKAPLPGIILELAVKEGDKVSKGQKLAVMEAMKMENEIKADKDGEIISIKVSQGQSVLQDDLIMEIG
jgi:biotin carboxyl carrier protein